MLGLDDKEMPARTRVHVRGHGEGTVVGFSESFWGRSEYTINFEGNKKAITLKLNDGNHRWLVI
jgi:hypothetical protein